MLDFLGSSEVVIVEAPLYLLGGRGLAKEMCVASVCLSCGTFRREL